ncbi:MAG TPA: hypothetical protein IAA18_03810 [Candidatus Pseudomonas excrementavium]|uniref:Uncharacterized protein n=1 Tax=Halopseudomonas bauzanensis TaxID=653930 RepID=A0A1I4PEW4_9GAMM|nr:hypothetical protein [Halopseudomonas bauzanensis]SES24359.1 hypothetical protein SAMN05216589_2819 [Halopseudomonas bauzanensis]SFM26322.1 hypothetical protein SAMN04487855_2951 [Halopseudomonas bauzanensis]HIZ50188.1 hypothetical protein [Candidatus Pseudomonas excrementavium]
MHKHYVNAVTIVAFFIALLTVLSIIAVHRTNVAHANQPAGIPCHTLSCHAMNPGHWL